MSRWSPDSFAQAWNFATFYHQGQTYGGVAEGVWSRTPAPRSPWSAQPLAPPWPTACRR
jgi:hypothetical protein